MENFKMENPEFNLLSYEYQEMVKDIKSFPANVTKYFGIFEKIFSMYKCSYGWTDQSFVFIHDELVIADFIAVPLSVIIHNDIAKTSIYIELLILSAYANSKIVKICKTELKNCKWIENLGVEYMYNRKAIDIICETIKILARLAPVQNFYLYSGWVIDKENTYILNGNELNEHFIGNELINKDDDKICCQYVLNMLDIAERRLTIVAISTVILSLVHTKLMDTGDFFKGLICFSGQSQSGKTSLAELFFGFANNWKCDINFESTAVSIIRTITNKRDSTIIVDDYKPTSTKAAKNNQLSTLEKIIRMTSDNSSGYQKAGINNTTSANVSHGIVILTAEAIDMQVQSSLARMLIIEINRKSVDFAKLSHYKRDSVKYLRFIEQFIIYISKQGVEEYSVKLKEQFLQERDTLRNTLLAKNFKVDNRTNDMILWLKIGLDEFIKYALFIETIDEAQSNLLKDEAKKIFLLHMEQQTERFNELDEIAIFFKGLSVLLDTKEVMIEQLNIRNNKFVTANDDSVIGFKKGDLTYLKNNIAFQKVVSYYRNNGREYTSSENTIRKLLINCNYIVPKKVNSYIHRLNVNNKNFQCITFETKKFKKLLGEIENESEYTSDRLMRENAENFFS